MSNKRMNDGVFRAHRMLFIFYALISAILSAGVVFDLIELHFYEAVQMGCIVAPFLAIALVHFFTARGAKRGSRGARIASRIIGVLMLLLFPLGTIVGIYLIIKTGSDWQGGIEVQN